MFVLCYPHSLRHVNHQFYGILTEFETSNSQPRRLASTATVGIPLILEMPALLEAWEAEWLSNLALMKQTIADLNLDKLNPPSPSEEAPSSNEDIWDLIERDLASSGSDSTEDFASVSFKAQNTYDRSWLRQKMSTVASGGLSEHELYDQVLAIIASDSQGNRHMPLRQNSVSLQGR